MTATHEPSALLPNARYFDFWEQPQTYTTVLHVACENPNASDENDGSAEHPFKTIGAAAKIAGPGTRVLVHQGTYREVIQPVMGGSGPQAMVSYETYMQDKVVVKASEVITAFRPSEEWLKFPFTQKQPPDKEPMLWEIRLDPDMFRGFNPFCLDNLIHDKAFVVHQPIGEVQNYFLRRGMVFCDGKPLKQVPRYSDISGCAGTYWVEANGQTVHFRLENDENPKDHCIEVTCREQCFAPDIPMLSYVKVKGFVFAHAATGCPVPQRGAVSCARGHHWIIEDCTIQWSNCVGIDCGNESWSRVYRHDRRIGYTVIRRNTILDCGVCGIAGMLATHLLIEDNLIKGTGWLRIQRNAEAGGIKLHGPVNSLLRRNIFLNTIGCVSLWFDCGSNNNRVTQSLFLDGIDQNEAILMECNKEEVNLIDNNIIWNVPGTPAESAAKDSGIPDVAGWEQDGEVIKKPRGVAVSGLGNDYLWVINNLIGKCHSAGYCQRMIAFRMNSGKGGTARDCKIYNNIFYDCGEAAIKLPTENNDVDGNVYARMPQGYLRIIYPFPTQCLNLKTWKKWYGFDENGAVGDFDIVVDSQSLTLEIVPSQKNQIDAFWANPETGTAFDNLPRLRAAPEIGVDYAGRDTGAQERIAGPFPNLKEYVRIGIDPRKHHTAYQ